MELAHGGDPGHQHLGERGPGQPEQRVGVEAEGEVVHAVPPAPERAGAGLGPRPERPVEHVGVAVEQPRHGQAGQPDGARRRPADVGRDPRQHRSLRFEQHAGHGLLAAQPRPLGVPRGHDGMGRRTLRSAATSRARW